MKYQPKRIRLFIGFAFAAIIWPSPLRAAPDEHGHEGEEHADEVKIDAEAVKRHDIRIEPVRRVALDGMIAAPARVAFNAEAMAHVGTPVEGRVAAIHVKLGDLVKKEEVLMEIDSPALGEAQSDWLQKKTSVAVARTTFEVAQTAYERSKGLLEGKGLSLGEFQRREGEYKIARGSLLSAEAAALAAENRLSLYGLSQSQIQKLLDRGEIDARYRVRAPIAGRVVEREATLGEIVGPDREALLVLADTTSLWVLADVPETRIADVRVGASASAAIAALNRQAIPGTVDYIAPALNAATRTAQVRIAILNDSGGVKPGMFAQVEISMLRRDVRSTNALLAVAETAIQTVEGGTAVFVPVPNEENTFAKRSISVGSRVGSMVPVLSGLKEGELHVASGSFILKAELGKSGAAHEH